MIIRYEICTQIGSDRKTFNKKAFQLDANRPLPNSACFLVNTFENVWAGVGLCTVKSKLNEFEHLYGQDQDPRSKVQIEQV